MGKKFITFIALIIFAFIVFLSVFNIKDSIKKNSKKEGFDTVLKGLDICTLALKDGSIYAGGASGLYQIDIFSLDVKRIDNFKYIHTVLSTKNGIWAGHDRGVTFIGSNTITYTTKDGLPDNRVNALALDKNNNIWIGTWGGAVSFDGETFRLYNDKNGLINNMVNVIMQDNYGYIWFGSYVAPRGGISIYKDEQWQYFTTSNDLIHANINAIIETQDKYVIAGGGLYTKGGGTVFTFKGDKWVKSSSLTKANGIAGEKIRSLFEDSLGRIWIGSEYDGLAVLDKNKIIKLNITNGLPNNEVKAMKEDEKGNIWIGTRGGLTRISKGGLVDEQLSA